MIELSIEQCRPYLVGILKHVDSFCRENDIKYSLGYGSLIGAIRHKGFIPWDDDIDIIMTRENYDKFIELHLFKTGEKERYRVRKGQEIANHLHAVVSDEDTTVVFSKGSTDDKFYHGGLWVDLFPLDNVVDEEAYRINWEKINKLRRWQMVAEVGALPGYPIWKKYIRNIIQPIIYPFTGLISRSLNERMIKENMNDTGYFASYSVWYWKQKAIPKDLFDEYIEVDFEGNKYLSICGYDKYLRDLYGDYMQFPPENQRVPKHNYKAYAKSDK